MSSFFASMSMEKKYKTFQCVSKVESHNSRLEFADNVNSKLSHLNRCYDLKTNRFTSESPYELSLVDRLKNLFKEKNIKPGKNSNLIVEAAFQVKREFFTDDKGKIDAVKLSKWSRATIDWAKKEFKEENILQIDLHLDETNPHIHVVFAPIIEKTKDYKISKRDLKKGKYPPGQTHYTETRAFLNSCHWMDGRDKLSELQTSYFNAVEHLGLKRGIDSRISKATHKTIKQHRKEIAKTNEQISQSLRSLDDAIDNIDKILDDEIDDNKKIYLLKHSIIPSFADLIDLYKTVSTKLISTEKENEELTIKNNKHMKDAEIRVNILDKIKNWILEKYAMSLNEVIDDNDFLDQLTSEGKALASSIVKPFHDQKLKNEKAVEQGINRTNNKGDDGSGFNL